MVRFLEPFNLIDKVFNCLKRIFFSNFLEEAEPVVTSEELTVLKNSQCPISFSLSNVEIEDESQIKVSVSHDDKPVDKFEFEVKKDENVAVLQKVIDEIEHADEGLYTIAVEYKHQKFVHKISVAVGKL